ncbi:MAG: hypothetical protein ABIH28_03610 [archaeon]
MSKEKAEELESEEDTKTEKKARGTKFKTAKGRTTRYSCLHSTVPGKSRSPPKV